MLLLYSHLCTTFPQSDLDIVFGCSCCLSLMVWVIFSSSSFLKVLFLCFICVESVSQQNSWTNCHYRICYNIMYLLLMGPLYHVSAKEDWLIHILYSCKLRDYFVSVPKKLFINKSSNPFSFSIIFNYMQILFWTLLKDPKVFYLESKIYFKKIIQKFKNYF